MECRVADRFWDFLVSSLKKTAILIDVCVAFVLFILSIHMLVLNVNFLKGEAKDK